MNFRWPLTTRLVAWCVPSARSQYLLLFGTRISVHVHAYLHAYISAKSYCNYFIFSFVGLSTCAYYCLMINVYLQVWHVPIHESNFMFRCCYIREAWTHSQVTTKWRLKKNKLEWLSSPMQFWVDKLHSSPACGDVDIISESYKSRRQNMPLKRTPFVDGASCSCCLLRRSISSLRAAANRSFSSRSSRASYSSSVSFRSAGSAFSDREGERSSSFWCLCLRFRLCRLSSPSVALPAERDRWRRLWRLWDLLSVSSSDSLLALTEGSLAGRKGHDKL